MNVYVQLYKSGLHCYHLWIVLSGQVRVKGTIGTLSNHRRSYADTVLPKEVRAYYPICLSKYPTMIIKKKKHLHIIHVYMFLLRIPIIIYIE